LPHAAAIVHHAGVGAIAQSLAAACPQLACPFVSDQWDNSNRALRLGVAREYSTWFYKPRRMAVELEALLSSEAIRERCAFWQQKMDSDAALEKACDAVETAAQSPGR
jgi:rhamnosyltransferase subunit B